MVVKTEKTVSCDICGAENAVSHSFVYDRVADAAGGMENLYYDIDLCSAHFAELVSKHGHPRDNRWRRVGKRATIAYGSGVKEWAEMQADIWPTMSKDDQRLALAIWEL